MALILGLLVLGLPLIHVCLVDAGAFSSEWSLLDSLLFSLHKLATVPLIFPNKNESSIFLGTER